MTDFWIAVTAIAGVVTAVGTAVMAVAIIYTAVVAVRTFEASKSDSRAKARPVIIAELKRELLSHGTIMLVLRNLGASVASNVRVTFDPKPPEDLSQLGSADMFKWIYERYARPITTWAPGWSLSNVIRAGQDELLPVNVTISYQGPDGTSYSDSYSLHPDHILKDTMSTPSKTDDPIKLEQHKLAALQALVRTIRSD
ncbi:hypothetical protein COUCH_02200 [Couchioplanes caeruleus]|uniref:hypothetical protein n=1 Tax=Couchioplanes caeruleus TaxID=56438 RepID=UPI0020BDA3D0|nr:hypothetical protein [Couchioplanes caeruleus]UQU65183.1 hypothetical protein COUCH_02200 [Couchioplanes caeruleus]